MNYIDVCWIGMNFSLFEFCWSSHTHQPKHEHTSSQNIFMSTILDHINCVNASECDACIVWRISDIIFRFFYSTCRLQILYANGGERWAVSDELSSKVYIIHFPLIIHCTRDIVQFTHRCVTLIKALKYNWHICNIQYNIFFVTSTCSTSSLVMKRWNKKRNVHERRKSTAKNKNCLI